MKSFSFLVLLASVVAVMPARAADLDAVAEDIVGGWQLDFTTPDDVKRTPIVLVGRQAGELVAWYVENGDPEPFEKVRLQDESLLLTIRPKERPDAKVTFSARLKEDGACHGEAAYELTDGDTGSWTFTGKRVAFSDFDDVTQWDLSFVTPDDERREATVTVLEKGSDLYAWYSSEGYELPAKKIDLSGDDVTLSITARMPDGADVDVTFRGTVDDDQVKGTAEYSLGGDSGTFPFTGRLKS